MTEKLSSNFLNELFRTAFRNKNIFDLLIEHLEFHYLPTQEYKEIWKLAKVNYSLSNELPTIGLIAEQSKDKPKTLLQLNQIKEADILPQTSLIKQIESYLIDVKFVDLYEEVGDLAKNNQKLKAIELLKKGTGDIAEFSLQAKQFESVFKGFEQRYTQRTLDNSSNTEFESKAIFGIKCLDDRTRGGVDKGKTCLFTARSGIGKSKLLKWIAYSNARLGKRVLHFQFEGSREECLLAYEAMIAGSPYYDLKTTCVDDNKLKIAIENSNKITGDIHVIAYEQFGSASMMDVRNSCMEYIKQNGNPDVIVLDYLDECEPGDGKKYAPNIEGQKNRKQAIAKLFTNLCVELKISGFIATQASDVDVKIWNNPNEVMTRSNIGSDRNLINRFSFHITLNQTMDEKRNNVMRLFEDKFRDYSSGKTHYICTAFEYEKFYDHKRTVNMFSE